ncbi:COG3740 Phage head maturation protease [uncultured Caudovirales phage]|uniref:COG3740 Phage head maturation protease n=1 Tax=uncultured Caudovirales phage TaxID=2100421 RepID=A0A6J5S365_9CAUD|nr:COG3740 Phage head maturation protease [uncultured Caudovirales phage]CAB4202318.1 COG3740 Phage head maturation protease [uncultured Caudovirales phage]CAB4214488.1 COG3740 Phage head maturation protease [uncultured Caudovirales phage]CAB5228873.1 COG3740 Phage head maturation protease [uncultured Caudovirales phage]
MPYFISDQQSDCSSWATVKQETDGSYTTLACHDTKQDAIDQMVAVSISEDMEPGGEVAKRNIIGEDRSKMKKIERRTFTVRNIETRQEGDGTMRLAGYAAVFNDPSVPLPFSERIAPGAFRKTLSETPDVRLLINHEGLPLARTKNNTLTLTEDETGLYIDATLPDTTEARDLWTLVQRGDVDQMSFAFRVIRQSWNKERTERTLTEVSLADGDVSVVTYPAYPTTTVEAREHLQNAVRAVKEGREISGESLMVLQTVFDDLTEGHDYIMKAVEVMATLMDLQEMPVEDMPEEDVPAEEMPVAGRSISLRLAQAIINSTK